MNPTPTESDDSLPEPLAQFEQELIEASDPKAVLERYRGQYPELAEILGKLADAMAMLQATPLRRGTEENATSAAVPLPERFGPYKVIRSIGRGGMGEVYEAVEEPLGRQVAVKTLRRQAPSPNLLRRFDRERRTLARLHHTNVVPIYATGSEGDLLYFAMPYLSGASLGQVIKAARSHEVSGNGLASSSFEELVREAHSRSQSASERLVAPDTPVKKEGPSAIVPPPGPHRLSQTYIRTAVQVMATVAQGLHHAHEAGVVHRDLKPGNILVETNGHAWVLDFGLAALSAAGGSSPPAFAESPSASESDASLTAGPLGTPPYTAPELHAYGKRADIRSDVWGLGVTLYELLTLQRAFPDGGAVVKTDPTSPRSLIPALDRGLEAVILKAIHKDPSQRYPTAQALADDLNHWLRREPVSVWPSHRAARPAWRLCLWSKRNKGWAVAIALALASMLSLGVYAEERARAKERQLQLLDIQRILQSEHRQGWSGKILRQIEGLQKRPEDRGAVQGLAVAALTGLDTRTERQFPIHAQSLAFAPDGRLWMGHTGEGPKRWDPETPRLESWPLELDGPLAIRPDGTAWQLGPTYTDPDRPGRIPLDPRPDPRFPLHLLDVKRQAIARSLAYPIEGGSRLLAWTLEPRGSHATAAVVDPQGRQWLLVWEAETGRLLHRIASQEAPESFALPGVGLAFAPDASLLASWDGSGRVDLWSVGDGRAVASFTSRNPVHCVAFGPNLWRREEPRAAAGRWLLAVGDANGLITLWTPGAYGSWHILHTQGLDVLSFAFSPDGTLLASAGRSGGTLWDVATGRRLVGLRTWDSNTALAFSPDGTRLACSSWTPGTKPEDHAHTLVLHLEPARGIRHLHGLPGPVIRATFSRDGKRVAALSTDWWAGVWERDTGRLIRLLAVPRGQFADNAALAFSPDGRRLAVSGGNTASIWDLETGAARRWELPWALTEALAFAGPDRLLLVRTEVQDGSRPPDSAAPLAEYPRLCVLRDLLGPTPKQPEKVISDFRWGVQDIEAAPGGSCFVVDGQTEPPRSGVTRSARVYDSEGRLLAELPTRWPARDPNGFMVFDPSGRMLALATSPPPENKQLLFAMRSGRFLGPMTVSARSLSPGARLLAWVEYRDRSIYLRLADRAGKLLIERLSENPHSLDVPFSPDLEGRFLLWGNPSGLVSVADLVEVQRRLTQIGLGW